MAWTIDANEVPQEVKDAFAAKFPNATVGKWEKEAEFEAEFTTEEGREVEVNFYPDGTITQVEYEIGVDELPAAVKEAIAKNYPHCEIEEAERVEKGDGTLVYEVDLSFEIHVTPSGKLVALGKDL